MTRLLVLALPLLIVACGDKDPVDSGISADDTGTPDYSSTQVSDGGTWSVSYTTDPSPIPAADEFTLTATVTQTDSANAQAIEVESVLIDAGMPQHGHGMTVTPETVDNGDGTWSAYPLKFHMTGDWSITVEITGGSGTETATFLVDCCDV